MQVKKRRKSVTDYFPQTWVSLSFPSQQNLSKNTAAHPRFRPRKRTRSRTIDGESPTYFNFIKLFKQCFLFLPSFLSFPLMLGNYWMKKFVLLKEMERRFNNVEVIFCQGHSAKRREKIKVEHDLFCTNTGAFGISKNPELSLTLHYMYDLQ